MEGIELRGKSVVENSAAKKSSHNATLVSCDRKLWFALALAYVISACALIFGMIAFLQNPRVEMNADLGPPYAARHGIGELSGGNEWEKVTDSVQKKLDFLSDEHKETLTKLENLTTANKKISESFTSAQKLVQKLFSELESIKYDQTLARNNITHITESINQAEARSEERLTKVIKNLNQKLLNITNNAKSKVKSFEDSWRKTFQNYTNKSQEKLAEAVDRMVNSTEDRVFGLYGIMNNSLLELQKETEKKVSEVSDVIHSTIETKFADVSEIMEAVRNLSRDNHQRITAKVDRNGRKYSDAITSTTAKFAQLQNDLNAVESGIVQYVKENITAIMNANKKESQEEIAKAVARMANSTEEKLFDLQDIMNKSLVQLKEETEKNASEVSHAIHLTFEAEITKVKRIMETIRDVSRDNHQNITAKVDQHSDTMTSTTAKLQNDLNAVESGIVQYVKENITAIMNANKDDIEEMQTNLEKTVAAQWDLLSKSQDMERNFNALRMSASDALQETKEEFNEILNQKSSKLERAIRNNAISVARNLSQENSRTNNDISALEETMNNITSTLWRQLGVVKSNLASIEHNLTRRFDDDFKSLKQYAKSCKELRDRGATDDGIYSIISSNTSSVYQVFCDMTTSGGGWTLVASVHENNIKGKCTIGDKWSSEQGISSDTNGANWMNLNTFGNTLSATSTDFKSPAYFSINASDVMVWHVNNDVPIEKTPEEAYLKYITRNGFLNSYGGSLMSLFSIISHLTPSGVNSIDLIYQHNGNGRNMIRNLANQVSDWYEYKYDHGTTGMSINDGGNDMYDGGNQVYYKVGSDEFRQVTYGENRVFNKSHRISSFAYHPFVFFMWIDNTQTEFQNYTIKVISNAGADGGGSFTDVYQSRSFNSLVVRYYAYCLSGASDPSICGVLFYAYNEKKWCSKQPATFTQNEWTRTTDNMIHSVSVTGAPANILMGYILLSRSNDDAVSWTQVGNVMRTMLQHIDTVDVTAYAFDNAHIMNTPVRFVRGTSVSIPPALRSSVSSGFIQFSSLHRKYNNYAFCPGVKVNKCFAAQYVCVGGFKTANDESSCGDYAGWMGRSGDIVLKDQTNGYAHSQDQIDSTLLIFTR